MLVLLAERADTRNYTGERLHGFAAGATAPKENGLSNYPKTGCNPRKIQDLRAFSDSY